MAEPADGANAGYDELIAEMGESGSGPVGQADGRSIDFHLLGNNFRLTLSARLHLSNLTGTQFFDTIRFASYRTACKIRFVQKKTSCECKTEKFSAASASSWIGVQLDQRPAWISGQLDQHALFRLDLLG